MRAMSLMLLLAVVACQRVDSAERSAAVVSTAKVAPVTTPIAPAVALASIGPTATEKHSCGGAGTSGCGGGSSCGGGMTEAGGCTGGVTAMPTWAALPADATWTELKVTGMHCGGCARRIEKQLATVDGVLGVKIDVTSARVAIATVKGVDARGMVKPAIDKLGYLVE